MEATQNDNENEKDNKKRLLSSYNKKKFLEALKSSNCNPSEEQLVFRGLRDATKNAVAKQFINEQAHTSQQRINLIMDHENNTSFGNLNNWARKLKTDATTDTKDISIPLLFELISKTEALPSPTETNGIDLKKIYSVLANLMAGYPIEKLDAASEAFLKECYKDLLEEVNETDVKGLKRAVHILNANDETDPLAAVSDILDRADRNLVKVLSNDEMNPLNLPLPFTER